MTVALSPKFSFPDEVVTQTIAILAKRGSGKSNTAAVMAEGFYDAHLPFVVIDPVGAWWGLRSSFDGRRPGLSIPIFGGHRGDIPLEPTAGELIADLIVSEQLSCVLDVSAFESESAKRRFLYTFAERLFRMKGRPGNDFPLHLFLEEADDYAPQRASGVDVNRTLGAFQRIVKQGRARGLGATMITQRSAVLNKDLLTQIETLIVMRTTSPQDRKAISAWVEYHDASPSLLESLSKLKDGEAWIWSAWLQVIDRYQVRRRRTFDSGATPSLSLKGKRAPATLADIDLASIEAQMKETIERAKEEDPRELRKRLGILERENTSLLAQQRITQIVETVPERVINGLSDWIRRLDEIDNAFTSHRNKLAELIREIEESEPVEKAATVRPAAPPPSPTTPAKRGERAGLSTSRSASSSPGDLPVMQRKILTALAQMKRPLTREQLLLLTGYRVGGAWNTAMARLRELGALAGPPFSITSAGLEVLGHYEPLPTGRDLYNYWKSELGQMAAKIMDVIDYNGAMDVRDLLYHTGYKVGGAWNTAMSKLRRLNIITTSQPTDFTDEFKQATR